MKACNCTSGLTNTGTSCSPLMAVQKKLILVPYFDSTGAQNSIPFSATLTDAYFSALINQTDTSKRWYPLPEMKNINDDRAEPIMETFEDASMVQVQQGVRKFDGLLIQQAPYLLNAIQAMRCTDIGVYVVDKDGNLIGSLGNGQNDCDPTYLYPIRIDQNSIYGLFEKTTDKKTSKIKMGFQFHVDENDANLRVITAVEANSNLALLNGLLSVCSDNFNLAHTYFQTTLKVVGYGTPINPVLSKGLVAADFALYNLTQSAAVTITAVTESPAGTYKIEFAHQTTANILQLTPTKTGSDFSLVVANHIQIPTT